MNIPSRYTISGSQLRELLDPSSRDPESTDFLMNRLRAQLMGRTRVAGGFTIKVNVGAPQRQGEEPR